MTLQRRAPFGSSRWYRAGLAAVVVTGVLLSVSGSSARASTNTSPAQGARKSPVVATSDGAVQGLTTGSTTEFLGIPYAAPPVGPLRWEPPQPAATWSGVLAATQFAQNCAQPASPFGVASTSENCLYLNVYAPSGRTGAAAKLPVMVWIHGGALDWGESNDYDPAGLVAHGVVVVTINYRLGALGFLANAALASGPGGPSGDYGLMDQQAALRWVQSNIAHFGGDAGKVTLFGESAGGLSVLSQLASPGAKGLFSRAIVESGTYALTTTPLATAEAAGESFATAAGCADQSATCLRSLPVGAILAAQNPAGYDPNVDSDVLPESLGTAFATGAFNHMPVIDGTNGDERRLFVGLYQLAGSTVTAANYESTLASRFAITPAAAAVVALHYPLSAYPSAPLAYAAAWTDESFSCPALTLDQSLSKYVATYAYEFNDQNAPERYLAPVGFPYGAAHESEVQYLFSLSNTAFPGTLSSAQVKLASTMKTSWTNFAKGANPSSPGGAHWSRFTPTGEQMWSLDTPSPKVATTFATEHQCAFWSQQS